MEQLRVINNSRDRKIAPKTRKNISATYRPVGPTCPPKCPLLDKECYAQHGFVNLHQLKSKQYSDSLEKVTGDHIRYQVSGGWFLKKQLDKPYIDAVFKLHRERPNLIGWSYTHDISEWINNGYSAEKLPDNLSIFASVDSIAEGKYANDNGYRYARVVDSWDDTIKGEAKCPYDVTNGKITCIECRLCIDKGRCNVAFIKKHTKRKG